MRIEFSPAAFEDLQTIGDRIAEDSPVNATKFIDKLIDRCLSVLDVPEGYIARPELGKNIRSVAFRKYMIFYSTGDDAIRIERILHGSRDYLNGGFL